ncbi:MAG: hypothetical protein WCK35_22600 [Chloroflexota bacterium]
MKIFGSYSFRITLFIISALISIPLLGCSAEKTLTPPAEPTLWLGELTIYPTYTNLPTPTFTPTPTLRPTPTPTPTYGLPTFPELVFPTPKQPDFVATYAANLLPNFEEKPIQAAKLALAQTIGIPPSQITLVNIESITWSDTCMGVYNPNVSCQQFEKPGYLIYLSANGQTYEYHTDMEGSQVHLLVH